MRYSLPCKVDGQEAWDVELDLADSENYVTEKVLENMGFVRVNLSDYGRKMVNVCNSWEKFMGRMFGAQPEESFQDGESKSQQRL
ncbi:hypothetical protein Tco_0194153 [Tanacetum coccineum]